MTPEPEWANRRPGSVGRGEIGEETPDAGDEGATPGRGSVGVGEDDGSEVSWA